MKSTMGRTIAITGAIALLQLPLAGHLAANDKGRGNNPGLGSVYVDSQGLYYDSFKTTMLKPRGRFQQLDPGGAPNGGPSTDSGPGDPNYVGGRWWIDTNADGEMDDQDTYFSCPLLGPGRSEP